MDDGKIEVCTKVLSKNCAQTLKGPKIIHPAGDFSHKWNIIFLTASIVSLFVDPLFLLVPEAVKTEFCIADGLSLQMNLAVIRSIADLFYLINIYVQFRTAYVEPSSRVFGRGELVVEPWKIALRYLRSTFWVDLAAALPLPQVYIWEIIPKIKGTSSSDYNIALRFFTMGQFLLRMVTAYPLVMRIEKASGIMSRAWFCGSYNLLFLMLSSEVSGCCWYLLGIQRQLACWRSLCSQRVECDYRFLDCRMIYDQNRNSWIELSNITNLCEPRAEYYQYGVYSLVVETGATSTTFYPKFVYLFWWGLQTLCSLGQNLITSPDIGENCFVMLVAIFGLLNYGLLIANIQSYVLSINARIDEWTIQRNVTEEWMHHRQLPHHLRDSIRKHDNYKWIATQGVNEEAILKGLPTLLRRQINRHLCLDLVLQVPLFKKMDDRLLDAICARLKPSLYTQGTLLISEGYPLTEMLLIVRGHLYSYTTDGGRNGFFNSYDLGPGDFFSEQLLTWALDPPLDGTLPTSSFTVEAITDVEAFVLASDDLKFYALQFRKLHSKELKHTLKLYSYQWRIWGACYIQAAWRRYKKRKLEGELTVKVSDHSLGSISPTLYEEMEVFVPRPDSGVADYALRLIADIRRGSSNRFGPDSYVTCILNS